MNHSRPNMDSDGFVGLRYWTPPEQLRDYFGSIYMFTVDRDQYEDMTRADMPQLRFMLSGGGYYTFSTGERMDTHEVCMLGATMGATRFNLFGRTLAFGVSVLPLGWLGLGCDSADAWINQGYDAVERHGPQYASMLETLRATSDPDAAVAQFWVFLAAQLNPVPDETRDMVRIIDTWLSENNNPDIEHLITATGLSPRQVARHTNRLYGAPPKLLARKYRALRCAAQIVIDRKNWRELCEEGTFYDQPHFIREIKQFLGLTPHQLLSDPTEVARLTVQRRALTGLMSELNRIS